MSAFAMASSTWVSFLIASILISISPGPGAVSAMASGANCGWRRGMWNVVGLQLGMLLLLLAVAGGLGALLAVSQTAFSVVKWIGAAYLAYLGIKLWLAKPAAEEDVAAARGLKSRGQLILEGFLVNATNPKGAVFMLAILPQFIDVNRPRLAQYAAITGTMVAVDLAVMAVYTALGARLLQAIRSPKNQQRLNRSFGTLFLAAAGWLALSSRHTR